MMSKEEVCNIFSVSRETAQSIDLYIDQLSKWSRVYALVGPKEIETIWETHVPEAFELADILQRNDKAIVDIGSGAGLPAVLLGLILPDRTIYMVESNQKKTTILNEIVFSLKINNKVIHDRIENTLDFIPYHDAVVTAKAFSSVATILSLVKTVSRETELLLPKSKKQIDHEIQEALIKWDMTYELIPSRINPHGVFFHATNIREKVNG